MSKLDDWKKKWGAGGSVAQEGKKNTESWLKNNENADESNAEKQYAESYARAKRVPAEIHALGAGSGNYNKSHFGNAFSAGVTGSAAGYTNAYATALEGAARTERPYGGVKEDARAVVYADNSKDAVERRRKEHLNSAKRVYKRADELQEKSADYTNRAKEGLGKVGQLLVDAGVSGTQMLGDAALNAVLPGSGLTAMGVRAFGSSAQEARQNGANYKQQVLYGGANAAVEVLSEKMFDGLSGLYGKGFLDKSKLAGGVSKAFSRMDRTAAGRTAKALLGNMGEEALEEVVAGVIEPAFGSIYNGKRITENYDENTVSDIIEAALVGGLLGGIGGSAQVMNNARQSKAYKAVYGSDSAALVQEALEINPNSKTAQRAQEKLQRGKQLSADEIRAIVAENEASMKGTEAENRTKQQAPVTEDQDAAIQQLADEAAGETTPANAPMIAQRNTARGVNGAEEVQERADLGEEEAETQRAALRQAERYLPGNAQEQAAKAEEQAETPAPIAMAAQEGAYAPEMAGKIMPADDTLTAQQQYERAYSAAQQNMAREAAGGEQAQEMEQYAAAYPGVEDTFIQAKPAGMSAKDWNAAWNVAYQMGAATTEDNAEVGLTGAQNRLQGIIRPEAVAVAYYSGMESAAQMQRGDAHYAEGGIADGQQEGIGGVRQSGKRNDGASAAREAAGMESRAREDRSRTKDRKAERLTGRTIKDGELPADASAQDGVEIVESGYTSAMKAAERIARKRGLTAHFWRGGDMVCDGVSCNGMIDGNEVWVRCDDPDFTAKQIMAHECTHDAIAKREIDPDKVWRKLEKKYGKERMDGYVEDYREALTGADMTEYEIEEEIICDAMGGMNKFEGKLDVLAEEYGAVLETARGEVEQQRERKRGPPEANKKPAEVGGVKMSLMGFNDGVRFVEVNTDQKLFDGLTIKEQQILAKKIIHDKFAGKTIGIDNKAFVNGATAKEFTHPVKNIKDELIKEAKMRASPELDNLLDAGSNFRTAEDGADGHTHKNSVGDFIYFDTIFRVNGEFYRGTINIQQVKNGKLLKDITKIENITQDITNSYGENPKFGFLRDASMDSIPTSSEKSKRKLSAVARDSEGRQLTEQQEEYFKDSKVRDENGNLKVMYHGTPNGGFTVFDRSKSGKRGTFKSSRIGMYFSEEEQYAKSMMHALGETNPTVYEVYLDIKKPLRVLTTEVWEEKDVRDIEEQMSTGNYDGIIDYLGNCVVFDSNQIKSVDNLNPTDDPDIRFSASGTEAVAALEAQNKELKEQIKALNAEKYKLAAKLKNKQERVNYYRNKATFSPEKVGKEILTAYNSALDETEIHDEIKDLLAYAGRKSGITYQILKQKAAEVADKVVKSAEVLRESETQEDYDAIRAYHKRVRLQVTPEIKSDFADWGDWWKREGRKIHAGNGETSNIDIIYAEMTEQFGEGYYPSDITNPADQLRRMAEMLDRLEPETENPYSYNMAYATEACTNDLCLMVMAEVARGYEGTITYQLNEQIYQTRRAAQEKLEKQAQRNSIARTVRTLDKELRNPTDEHHIPEELRGMVGELCSIFTNNRATVLQKGVEVQVDDHAIFDKYRLAAARAYYADLRGSEEYGGIYDEETAQRMQELEGTIAGKRLSSLTLEELRDVRRVVEHIRFVAKTKDEMFINGRKMKIQSVAEGVMMNAQMHGQHAEITLKDGKGLSIKRMIAEGNLKPEFFFRRMGDRGLLTLWHDIMKGQNTYAFGLEEAKKFYEETVERLGVKEWLDRDKKMTGTDASGRTMELDMEQAMYLLAAYKREKLNGTTNHILGGGFVYEKEVADPKLGGLLEKRKTDKRAHTLNEDILYDVEQWLRGQDERIMDYVDTMVKYLSDDMSEKGNETSLALHGYKKFLEKYYIPMQSASEYLESRFDSTKTNSGTNYKNKGMTKRTQQGANNPIVLRDFDEVWGQHVNEMLLYNAMAVQQDNLQRIINYKTPVDKVGNMASSSVKESLTNAYGEEAVQYITNLMRDINGGLLTDSREAGINELISLFKKNAVFASLSVAIQQPSSIARAMAVMDGKYLVKTAAQKRDWNELKKWSGVAIIKEIGGFDTTTGRSGANWLMEKTADKSVMDKLDEAGAYLPGKMDEVTWCHIWNAVKAEIADTTELEKGSETYFKRCAERFEEVIELSQVYDSVLTRSENMRSKSGVMKMATSFMAEPTVTLNMVAESVHNLRNRTPGAKKALGRIMGAVLVSILLNNLLKAIVTAPRDKDEDKTYAEKYAKKFAGGIANDINPLTYIPVVSDLVDVFDGYSAEVPYIQPFETAWEGISKLAEDTDGFKDILYEGDWSGVSVDGVADAVNGIAGLFGIPAKNVWRDARSVVTLFKETAPIRDTTVDSVTDAAWEAIAGSKTTTERVEDYYNAYAGKNTGKQEKAKKDMEKLWQSKYQKAISGGSGKADAEKKANTSMKSSVTSVLGPKYRAAKTQAEKNRLTEMALRIYVGGHQLYNGYDFKRFWGGNE
ncbi:MAG: hypothetical protein KBS74_02185 [Clostridiales bacterium]|nr:hypothetical protein [Candidatus Cacconaster stercorequi]